ncbi:MAG: hypothetical protein B6244_10525 [Candidatus Cloacimonetes bacterium 4572_55]|nr:MAG: hypothetical protein B6244_10525 [Candidatus Cloacimonetes bacterium 4572_55]
MLFFNRKSKSVFSKSEEISEALSLPVLGEISSIKIKKSDKRATLLSASTPQLKDAYDKLAQEVMRSKKSLIMVTNSTIDEEKSMVTANLAIALGAKGKRVIAVDCDFERPELHLLFGLEDAKSGVAEMVTGKGKISDTLIETSEKNVSVIASGATNDPDSLLSSPELGKMLSSLGFSADIVLINAPFVSEQSKIDGLVSKVKNALFVHQLGKTDKSAAQDSCSALKMLKINVLGIVNIAGGKKAMAIRPEKSKKKPAGVGKKKSTGSSGSSETKTYIFIFIGGVLVIAVLGIIVWYLIIQKFSSTTDNLIKSTPYQTTETALEEDGEGEAASGVFGVPADSDAEENDLSSSGPFGTESQDGPFGKEPEETPASQPTSLNPAAEAAPTGEVGGDNLTDSSEPGNDEKSPTAVAVTEGDEKSPTTAVVAEGDEKLGDTPAASTESKPETVAEAQSSEKEEEPKSEEPSSSAPSSQPTAAPTTNSPPTSSEESVKKTVSESDYPKIGRLPFSILIHSFSVKSSDNPIKKAISETQRLKIKGYGAYWTKANINGEDWYRVLVGVYATGKQAVNVAKSLGKELKTETSVIKLPYAIELGWQTSIESANAVAKEVTRRQYSTYRIIESKDDKRWVLLRTGAFKTKAEAEEYLKYVKSDGFKGRVVMR